jgi:putative oxidoreductase
MTAINVIARILLAVIFVASGLAKIQNYGFFSAIMMAHRLPAVGILLPLTIAVEVLGGLTLATGYMGRLGALALFLFLIPTTIVFHTGAVLPIQPGDAMAQQVNLLKNLAIMGGLLLVVANGPGPGSLGARRRR